jgi:membrane-associated HD superfamily phosphohydrolase
MADVDDGFGTEPRRLNSKLVFAMVKSGVVGFIMVLFLSSVLYETSVNTPFAVLNGLTLLLMLVAMVIELKAAESRGAPMMTLIVRLGMLVTLLAAIGTYIIRFAHLGPFLDVAFLVSTASGNCYCACYVLVSLYNKHRQSSTFVARQVYTMAGATLLVGGISGFVFAVADVEDHVTRLGWEQWVCAVAGFIGGGLIGHANYFAQDESMIITFDGLEMDDDV